ncbi:MAG: ubiquinone biosynthesis methyltransferase UbiE [Dehalococcoidia bacterium]|mgnify:CR=1 FL=1|nr:ubiquinone biosynthesis methyltransferase UbiE [Dehalococcoidia bacterium]HCV00508.1 ubiquinone biosynthesis methyltransferase UbiE [Dehalococcoidia bacterium]|tara:strand:- start:9325 stop:10020 length:696 start_codon:yes stop_codon:yes gene_type:complete
MGVLPKAHEKAEVVRTMFDRIAPSYDRMNRIITLGLDQRWRRSLIAKLEVSNGDTVLDLACGTGDFAVVAQNRGARVIALDFAGAMLLAAQERCPASITLTRGDALALPLASESISVAVSGFALRNFVAISPVLEELGRVLRQGGRLGLLEVDSPQSSMLRLGHGFYFRKVVPVLGALLSDGRAYRYLPASTDYLPSDQELEEMLESAGFKSIEKQRHLGGVAQSITAVRA